MKTRNEKKTGIIILMMIASIAIAFAFTACTETEYVYLKNYGQIYAFGTNILVTGDMGVENFDNVRYRLQEVMSAVDSATISTTLRNKFTEMLTKEGFTITIKTGTDKSYISPDGRLMTIGVVSLFSENNDDLVNDIGTTMANYQPLAKVMPVDSKSNTINSNLFAKQELA